MRIASLCVVVAIAWSASASHAFEFRRRWVERIGNTDVVIGGDGATFDMGHDAQPRRLRLKYGVFDDAAGAAPAGGFVAWSMGTMTITGAQNNSVDRRTPGRLGAFTFFRQPGANGNPPVPPGGDVDFQMLTGIDAALGYQTPFWGCTPAPGEAPLPRPMPEIRGLNEFISVFEITTDPALAFEYYDIIIGGNLVGATEWRTVGTPNAPDCGDPDDPNDNTPGQVVYTPFTTIAVTFTSTLHLVPAPGVLPVLCAGLLALGRRRQTCNVR